MSNHQDTATEQNDQGKSEEKLGLGQVVGSVLAAGLGVQSSRNRKRDFQHGKPVVFIIAGLIFTALFIAGVFTVVSLVLEGAGR